MEKARNLFAQNTPAFIVGTALLLAVIVGGVFYTTKSAGGNTLTVTGSAKQSVVADNAIWRSSITRNVLASDVKGGYVQLAGDLRIVQAFMAKNGITDKQIIILPVSLMQDYSQDANDPKRYTLTQSIEIDTADVAKITDIAKNVDGIVGQGVLFQSNPVEYYYSQLDKARVELLTAATDDAKARAAAMAKSSNQSVGKLRSASSGVVQVLSKGAVDNGEYGQYDTSKIDKDISVTVRATFGLK